MKNIEFSEDISLDNRQESIDFSLIGLSYKKIKRRVLKFKRRSGYSLISDKDRNVSYDEIGEVQEWYSANMATLYIHAQGGNWIKPFQ